MYVEWDPETGEDKQTWQFDSGEVGRKAATQIEKHFDGSWDQWLQALMIGQIHARAVLLWYMLTQVHPQLKFDDVPDFRVRQLTVHMGVAELRDLWKRVKRMKLSADKMEMFQSQFEADFREALDREDKYHVDFHIDERGDLKLDEQAELPKAL